jgi:hypothetical protein
MVYKTLVRLVITYASESWVLPKADERSLDLFERRVLRCISGAVQDTWRNRFSQELYKLFNEPSITEYIVVYRAVTMQRPRDKQMYQSRF